MADTRDFPLPKKIVLIFTINGVEFKAPIKSEWATHIPALSEFIQNSTDVDPKKKLNYQVRCDVTRPVVVCYIKNVRRRMGHDVQCDYALSPEEWIMLFTLADSLEDNEFFDKQNQSIFPHLDIVASHFSEMATPAKIYYIGCHLAECFMIDVGCGCDCDRQRVVRLKNEGQEWLESLSEDERAKYQNIQIPGRYLIQKKKLVHTYGDDVMTKEEWEIENAVRMESGEIYNWYELDFDIMIHLVHIGAKTPKCTCKREFGSLWQNFFNYHPHISKFTFEKMDRDTFMKYAKTSYTKKDSAISRKGTFEEAEDYWEFSVNGTP